MKKVLIILAIFLVFLIIYFLQVNFFNVFTIAGVKPNLFIIFTLFLGLFAGRKVGTCLGVCFGILLDIFIGKNIGMAGILLGVIGFLGGYLDKNFSKDSKITIILMVIGASILYEFGVYLLNSFILSYTLQIWPFIKIILVEILYNAILTVIFYPLLRNVGVYIENVFKESNILTKYF